LPNRRASFIARLVAAGNAAPAALWGPRTFEGGHGAVELANQAVQVLRTTAHAGGRRGFRHHGPHVGHPARHSRERSGRHLGVGAALRHGAAVHRACVAIIAIEPCTRPAPERRVARLLAVARIAVRAACTVRVVRDRRGGLEAAVDGTRDASSRSVARPARQPIAGSHVSRPLQASPSSQPRFGTQSAPAHRSPSVHGSPSLHAVPAATSSHGSASHGSPIPSRSVSPCSTFATRGQLSNGREARRRPGRRRWRRSGRGGT
jgi:hypothetical protein